MQDQESERWDDVRVFLEAYRLLSLGMAASRLGVDTSTVSRRLAALERRLGVRLFARSREGLLRTVAAEQLFEAAEAMEAAHARLSRDASSVEANAEGTVRLTLDPGLAEFFVAPALARFRAKHPRIDLELDASPIPRDLRRREADLALRSSKLAGSDLVTTKISVETWMAVGAPTLIGRLGALSSWDAAPWITWDRDMSSYAPAQWIAKHAPRAPTPLRTSHFASQIVAAEAGLGLALLPAPYARRPTLERARTTRALAASVESWPRSELWLVAPRILRDVPRVAAVWTFLVEEMRAIVGSSTSRARGR
ncbi:LysR family transcriptional regulator [Sorangium sp. So ce887]|uniref:LysR family transcriptional regulator n=1 Tax=Sorangium sp. So ce887 TaxID=3133324 RepID=UPI003F606DE0